MILSRKSLLWICCLYLILGIVFFVLWRIQNRFVEGFDELNEGRNSSLKAYYINLDEKVDLRKQFETNYAKSPLSDIPCNRISGVVGKSVDPSEHLSKEALTELEDLEKNKRKQFNYQLTRGAIGCFLSHILIYRRIVDDGDDSVTLVLEDDIDFKPTVRKQIEKALQGVDGTDDPWDIYLLGWHRKSPGSGDVSYFWGTYGYLIRPSGAAKILAEVESEGLDGQIDAVLSRMQQKGGLVIRSGSEPVIIPHYTDGLSTVQEYKVQEEAGTDRFDFRGYRV